MSTQKRQTQLKNSKMGIKLTEYLERLYQSDKFRDYIPLQAKLYDLLLKEIASKHHEGSVYYKDILVRRII